MHLLSIHSDPHTELNEAQSLIFSSQSNYLQSYTTIANKSQHSRTLTFPTVISLVPYSYPLPGHPLAPKIANAVASGNWEAAKNIWDTKGMCLSQPSSK